SSVFAVLSLLLPSPCSPCPSISLCFPGRPPPALSPLSLHDALPISDAARVAAAGSVRGRPPAPLGGRVGARPRRGGRAAHRARGDRKSTRLNSSHGSISYAVVCLTKKRRRTGEGAGDTAWSCCVS